MNIGSAVRYEARRFDAFAGTFLHRIRNVEHAHSPAVDAAVSGHRGESWYGLRLVALGIRAIGIEAARQWIASVRFPSVRMIPGTAAFKRATNLGA